MMKMNEGELHIERRKSRGNFKIKIPDRQDFKSRARLEKSCRSGIIKKSQAGQSF